MFISTLNRTGKLAMLCSILIWWVVSITPFGVKGLMTGPEIFIPTADGSIPSGAYAGFYQFNREGFYSNKYRGEIVGLIRAIPYLVDPNRSYQIVGSFNEHFLKMAIIESEQWQRIEELVAFSSVNQFPDNPETRALMLQRTYLSVEKMPESLKKEFIIFLKNGQVRNLYPSEKDSFPQLIEIGNSVQKGNDLDLGGRILFVQDFYGGNAITSSTRAPILYKPTFWLRKDSKTSIVQAAIYQDADWTCSISWVEGSETWILELPEIFANERDPNRVSNTGS